MSNILIIKHGSLGDIAQASGAIQIYLKTTKMIKYFYLQQKLTLIYSKKILYSRGNFRQKITEI